MLGFLFKKGGIQPARGSKEFCKAELKNPPVLHSGSKEFCKAELNSPPVGTAAAVKYGSAFSSCI